MRPNNRIVDTNDARVAERRATMECENCAFWYVDVDDETGERPYCHYSGDDQYAPCNFEDD